MTNACGKLIKILAWLGVHIAKPFPRRTLSCLVKKDQNVGSVARKTKRVAIGSARRERAEGRGGGDEPMDVVSGSISVWY